MLRILKNEKGFTLIELVIIIILIGVLAAIAIPKYVDLRNNAVEAAAMATLDAGRAGVNLDFANKVLGAGYTTDPFPVQNTPDDVLDTTTDVPNLEAMLQGTPNYPPNGGYDNPTGDGFRWLLDTEGTYTASSPQPPVIDAILDATCASGDSQTSTTDKDCYVSKL